MTERLVHICNGDATADSLSLADLPGDIRVWGDALDQGPVRGLADAAHHVERATFWASRAGDNGGAAELAAWDHAVDDLAGAEEVVLWFEHDLPDQLALARILARMNRRGFPPTLTIVSIDRHPEVPNFLGLGQLQPEQLAQLWPNRTPLSRDAVDEAMTAWIAITSPDPRALPFLVRRIKAMPFLAGALERHLEEFPDPTSGMSRTERQVLAAFARGEGASLVVNSHAIDPRYPISDVLVGHVVATLTKAGFVDGTSVTALGRQALAGAIDRVAEVGIDEWRGGVHLEGRGPTWRWDARARAIVER
ncbi:MAG: DUF1835 domain-containing protein [Proteobacteria bacterium]|nr:DUF1835 domain-containing protein [Pseudomonadota bacterium]